MIGELVIHLGDTKTGSTSIQTALVRNLCNSPAASIFYPTTRRNHNALAYAFRKKRLLGERSQRLDQLGKAFRESNANIGIISAEHFQFVDPQVLQEAIVTFWPDLSDRIRLIAYVRPHSGKFLSTFSERLKLGHPLRSLEEFFRTVSKSGFLDYTPRFEKWREVFGDRFVLRPFLRERLYQGDVVHDFFHHVLSDTNFEISGRIEANPSLTVGQLSLLREMQIVLRDTLSKSLGPRLRGAQDAMGRLVAERLLANGLGQNDEKLYLPAELASRLQERYAADAEALDTAFFEGFPMSNALEKTSEKVVETAQSLKAESYFPPDTVALARIHASIMADLLMQNPGNFKRMLDAARMDAFGSA